jgi:hypothetical protein
MRKKNTAEYIRSSFRAPTQAMHEPADMAGVIVNSELAFYRFGDPGVCPEIALVSMRHRLI